ncbi:hypothetical protein BG006_004084, partial [Podila minutissima]
MESPTEADVEITRDCQEGDIVITQDSDLAMYNEVMTIWWLISGSCFLEYKINEEVLSALIVSHNDYNHNISGLGCATNFKIIKELHGSDTPVLVAAYLTNAHVVLKNKERVNFDTTLKVFVQCKQTKGLPLSSSNAQTLDEI